jgi:hypothetical protein
MIWKKLSGGVNQEALESAGKSTELEPELELALREFRQSVHAWSEAAISRPRLAIAAAPRKRLWRLVAGWTFGCVLAAGGLSAGVFEHHQQQMRIARQQAVEQQRQRAEQQTRQARLTDEELLAKVDSDISQAVPSALEPLAQLMTEDGAQ